MRRLLPLALLAAVTGAAPDPLAAERWRHRVVLVFADRADDAALATQRESLASDTDGARRRDIRVIEIVGDHASPAFDAAALRASLQHMKGFLVALIGKDGGVKLRSRDALPIASLFRVIDAMPMARAEAARRGAP